MKHFPGTPGTLTGLLLRISQCIFAASSIAYMTVTYDFFKYTPFCCLVVAMSLQVIWSFGLAIVDSYSLASEKAFDNYLLLRFFVVGDWATATLSLAAASASAGIVVLYINDFGECIFGAECHTVQMSVASAFLSWFTTAISSLILLWIMT